MRGYEESFLTISFCFPSLIHNFIIIKYWDVCGWGNSDSLCQLKYFIKVYYVDVLIIEKPKISGINADKVC